MSTLADCFRIDLHAERMRDSFWVVHSLAAPDGWGEWLVAPGFTLRNVHVMAGVPAIFEAMVASVLPKLTGGAPLLRC